MENKKQVIIKEILYWQENRLLPEQYCKFLLNLYREGEEGFNKSTPKKSIPLKQMFLTTVVSLFLFFSVLILIFFQSYTLPVQSCILIGMNIFLYGLAIWFKKKQNNMFHIALAIASLMMLFSTVWIGLGIGVDQTLLMLLLIFVLLIWFLMGVIMHSSYMMGISLVGMLIAYGRFIHPWVEYYESVWMQHLLWFPIAALFISLSIKFKYTSLGKPLFYTGILAIIMPNGHSIFLEKANSSVTLIFIILEVTMAGIFLYYMREKWVKLK